MKVLSLFSGIGMGDLGLMMAGMEIVGQCEIDPFCQKVLALRFPESYKWRDVRDVKGKEVKSKVGAVDIVAGGFPCQPFSTAGNQRGDQDDRHLWPEMLRVVSEVRPAFVLGENVPGFIDLALDDVLDDLEGIGYETATFVFPAHAFGAPHRRDRVWIVGYSKRHGRRLAVQNPGGSKQGGVGAGGEAGSIKTGNVARSNRRRGGDKDVADTIGNAKGRAQKQKAQREFDCLGYHGDKMGDDVGDGCGFWRIEPDVGRVAHGVSDGLERLKALGNGQVVYCTKFIGEKIMEFENEMR